MSLPDDVALFIAGRIKSNIRELEGSLIRLLAYASLTGRDISMALAQEVLRDILRQDERALTIDGIQKFVADYYQMKMIELKSRNNSKSVALPRQVAMYLCKTLTNASLPEIGKSFGGKHHSTVIHSIRKVEDLRKNDAAFNTLINTLLESLREVFHSPQRRGLWITCGRLSPWIFDRMDTDLAPEYPQARAQGKSLIINKKSMFFSVTNSPLFLLL